MSDEQPMESKEPSADELAKKPGDAQLAEEDLKQVNGGLATGTHIPKVIIELRRPTGKNPT
jgi:hypothetical protein